MNAAKPRCKRGDGTERAWFQTRTQAIEFARDPANHPAYLGDVPTICSKCDGYHLSPPVRRKEMMRKEFGPSQGSSMLHGLAEAARQVQIEEQNELPLTPQDAQLLENMGISGPARMDEHFRCVVCGSVMRENIEFLILPTGDIRCANHTDIAGADLERPLTQGTA